MMIFWMVGALMLLTAMLFVVIPLWRSNSKINPVQRDKANLEIFRDQVAEMDTDFQNGLLSQEMYEQGKRELQARLLDEVGDEKTSGTTVVRNPLKVLAIVLSISLPLAAAGIYWAVGNHQAILQQPARDGENEFGAVNAESSLKQIEEMVSANPDDPNALYQLASLYIQLGRFADAAKSFDKLTSMVPGEAQLWADYADILAMVAGKNLAGKPTELLKKALSLDPNNFKALALAGSAAMDRGDYQATVRYWEKLLKLIPKDNENRKVIEDGIQQARTLMAHKAEGKLAMQPQPNRAASTEQHKSVKAGQEAISGTVILSAELKGKASPDDTLFVLVRAAQGPKMPLAIVRKQVRDLPYKFTLDDSTAMSPQMKLSNFDQVVLVARISKTGNAMTQQGDLYGISSIVKPGSKGIELHIDTIKP